MSKINKEIAIFTVILILAIFLGLFTKAPVNTQTQVYEPRVGSLEIQFKDGISEPEVKAILQNFKITMNYSIEYDTNDTDEKYYIMIDKNKIWDVRGELAKVKNWNGYAPAIRKGNYFIITIPEQILHDENFLVMLHKYNLQLKKFIWCRIKFEQDGSKYWIPEKDAVRIKNELEKNDSIFSVHLGYLFP